MVIRVDPPRQPAAVSDARKYAGSCGRTRPCYDDSGRHSVAWRSRLICHFDITLPPQVGLDRRGARTSIDGCAPCTGLPSSAGRELRTEIHPPGRMIVRHSGRGSHGATPAQTRSPRSIRPTVVLEQQCRTSHRAPAPLSAVCTVHGHWPQEASQQSSVCTEGTVSQTQPNQRC